MYHPNGWIIRVERYFHLYKLNEKKKNRGDGSWVRGSGGEALSWYDSERSPKTIWGWPDLQDLEFSVRNAGSLYKQWMAVVQTGTVLEYRREFIKMATSFQRVCERNG